MKYCKTGNDMVAGKFLTKRYYNIERKQKNNYRVLEVYKAVLLKDLLLVQLVHPVRHQNKQFTPKACLHNHQDYEITPVQV